MRCATTNACADKLATIFSNDENDPIRNPPACRVCGEANPETGFHLITQCSALENERQKFTAQLATGPIAHEALWRDAMDDTVPAEAFRTQVEEAFEFHTRERFIPKCKSEIPSATEELIRLVDEALWSLESQLAHT